MQPINISYLFSLFSDNYDEYPKSRKVPEKKSSKYRDEDIRSTFNFFQQKYPFRKELFSHLLMNLQD